MKKYICFAALAGLIAGYLFALKTQRPAAALPAAAITLRDTLVVRDTIVTPPVVVKEYVVTVIRDTLPALPLNDSTARVEIPLTRKVYADSNYRAVISGYRPELDSLVLFPPRQVITQHIIRPRARAPRFSIGIQVGYGTDFHRFSPYIGIGVQYNLLSW